MRKGKWMKHIKKTCSDIFKLKNVYEISELAKMQFSVQTKTKLLVVMQVMQSASCAPARRLKIYRSIALLSLWEHTGMENWQMNVT